MCLHTVFLQVSDPFPTPSMGHPTPACRLRCSARPDPYRLLPLFFFLAARRLHQLITARAPAPAGILLIFGPVASATATPPPPIQRIGSHPSHQLMSLPPLYRSILVTSEKDQIIHLTQGGPAAILRQAGQSPMSHGVPDLPLSPNTVIMPPAPPIVPPLHYTFSRECL